MGRREERRFREDRERALRAADLEALRVLRDYLIFKANTRGDAWERLRGAIDDYAGENWRPNRASCQACQYRTLNVLGLRIFHADSSTR